MSEKTDYAKFVLPRDRMHLAEHWLVEAVAVVPADCEPEDIRQPTFFSGVVGLILRPNTRLFVQCEDGRWIADCWIPTVGPSFADVRILNVYMLTDEAVRPPVVETPDYEVKWGGTHHKWRVIRKSDNATVHSGAESKSDAQFWLDEHLKAIAR